jgi:hypothetical protein
VLFNEKVLSYRITLRSSDGLWVLDNWFQVQGEDRFDTTYSKAVTVAKPSRPYNAMLPGFRNLGELLACVHETRSYMHVDPREAATYN